MKLFIQLLRLDMSITVEFHAGSLTLVVVTHLHEETHIRDDLEPFQAKLTLSEFLVLKALVAHRGQHLSKEHLTHVGWPQSYVGPNSLNMSIMSLRKKLSYLGGFWQISTIQRHGYSLDQTLSHRYSQINVVHFGLIGTVEY